MTVERTLSIIKPDATERNLIGEIIALIESSDLSVVAMKMAQLSVSEASEFYAVHKARPFYQELVSSMTAGRVVMMVLEGENAVLKYREVMGATNPEQAEDGTIRKLFAISVGENSVHGSDSIENAATEISFFFKDNEICHI